MQKLMGDEGWGGGGGGALFFSTDPKCLCVKPPLSKRPKIVFIGQLSLNAGHK